MSNEQNLKKITSTEQARALGRKGGKKRQEQIRARKTLRDELLALLSNGGAQKKMSLALYEKACSGDTKAFEVIRDTIGEKPKEVQDVNLSGGFSMMPSVKFDGKEFVPNIGEDVRSPADT